MPANKPYIIGLTGGIGCGKSEAAQFLKSLGAAHIDADEISRALTGENGEALPEIRERFGDGAFREDGTLDRARMAEFIFSNEAARRALEGILHPLVQRTVLRQMDEAAERGETESLSWMSPCYLRRAWTHYAMNVGRCMWIVRLKSNA